MCSVTQLFKFATRAQAYGGTWNGTERNAMPAACRSQLTRQCPYGTIRPQPSKRNGTVAFFLSADRQLSAPGNPQGHKQATTMMPVGVPRLPYRVRPGRTQWIDLWNIFYLERIIWITKPIDNALANELIATMLYLDADKQKPMQVRHSAPVSRRC